MLPLTVLSDWNRRTEAPKHDVKSATPSETTQSSTSHIAPPFYLTTTTQTRTFRSNNPPPSRLEYSLLRYTPVEYSRFLQSSLPAFTATTSNAQLTASEPVRTVQSSTDEVDVATNTETNSSPLGSTPPRTSSPARSRPSQVYTPFMRLMEITAKININDS